MSRSHGALNASAAHHDRNTTIQKYVYNLSRVSFANFCARVRRASFVINMATLSYQGCVFECFAHAAGRHTTTLPCAPHGDDDTDDDDDDEDDERDVVVARVNLARADRLARTAAATFQMARRGCLWWGWRARASDGHGGVGSRA